MNKLKTVSLTRWIIFQYTLFLVLVIIGSPVWAANQQSFVDHFELQKLLYDKSFRELNTKFTLAQNRYELGKLPERQVAHMYGVFDNTDTNMGKLLQTWIAEYPKSYAAHAAYGAYQSNMGFARRGGRFISMTKSSQIQAMEEHFERAIKAYSKSQKYNKRLMFVYSDLIRVTSALGGGLEAITSIWKKANSQDPTAFSINIAYLIFLQPKWGGSISLIRDHLDTIAPLAEANPDLKRLQGFDKFVQGEIKYRDDQDKVALILFDQAIQQGELGTYYDYRGRAYRSLGQYKAAINDYTQALNIYPQSVQYLVGRASAYKYMGQNKKAIDDLDTAIRLDRYNKSALNERGLMYYDANRYREAKRDLMNALTMHDENSTAYRYLGFIAQVKKRYTEAVRHLTRSVEIDPDSADTWYYLASNQYRVKDCGFIQSGKEYIKLCRKRGKCKQKRVNWINKSSNYSIKRGICPQL